MFLYVNEVQTSYCLTFKFYFMKNLNFAKEVLASRTVERQTTEDMTRVARNSNARISFAARVLASRVTTRETTEEMVKHARRISKVNHLAKAV